MNTYSDVPLRGTFFRTPTDRAFAEAMSEGLELSLLREPENEHDSNAIKVLFTDPENETFTIHLGYVAREIAAWIAPELDAGNDYTCFLTSIDRSGKSAKYELIITTDA